jgi:hypothetical protein
MAVVDVPAQETVIDSSRVSQIDQVHAKWIDHVMRSISTIKPGMTRKDLYDVFREEGGISFRTQKTYVHKHCPYIKVDVDFDPVENQYWREPRYDRRKSGRQDRQNLTALSAVRNNGLAVCGRIPKARLPC